MVGKLVAPILHSRQAKPVVLSSSKAVRFEVVLSGQANLDLCNVTRSP